MFAVEAAFSEPLLIENVDVCDKIAFLNLRFLDQANDFGDIFVTGLRSEMLDVTKGVEAVEVGYTETSLGVSPVSWPTWEGYVRQMRVDQSSMQRNQKFLSECLKMEDYQ